MSNINIKIKSNIRELHLPRFSDIPTVGLYLEQVVRYVNSHITLLGCAEITSSMVGNYVKQGTIPGPIKKAYSAESIAYLIFVAVVKSVLQMDDIRLLIRLQKEWYSYERAYNYFCDEVENVLQYIFGFKEQMDKIGAMDNDVKDFLRNTVIAVGWQLYLDNYLNAIHEKVGRTAEEQSK